MTYYEKDYYAVPDTGAEKAYELLRQALLAQKKVAIAKIVMGTNEKLLVLYPTKEGIKPCFIMMRLLPFLRAFQG